PGMHYSMGGLWAGYEKKANGDMDTESPKTGMTNIPGVYAAGEASHQYHGGNRLGANSLVSCIYDGMVIGPAAVKYTKGVSGTHAEALPDAIFENAVKEQEAKYAHILQMDGSENPYVLADELGKTMTSNVTVVRYNAKIKETLVKIAELKERYNRIGVPDTGSHSNQPAVFTRWLHGMLVLAEAIAQGALLRDESRGSHYKPDFPERDDDNFLKTTIAVYSDNGPVITYEPVDVSHITPRKRDYTKK
ncbi:MAG: FAD-binding protein, partial [Mycobacterium leprae]